MEKQELLALFFAIFWGGIMNVQGRWRMFQPVLRYPRILGRFALSLLMMVVLPILFFAWQVQLAGEEKATSTAAILASVLPALGVFVFYRLWMVVVEFAPRWFYWSETEAIPHNRLRAIDPSIETLTIGEGFTIWWNTLAAVIYAILAIGIPALLRCL